MCRVFPHLAGSISQLQGVFGSPIARRPDHSCCKFIGAPDTLANLEGVAPTRLNMVYALNRLHPTGLEPGPPAQYLAELTSLALHTVFPLRTDKRVGSPA